MFLPLSKAILKTIIYADIFDYPLTLKEIKEWLIEFRIKKQELSLPAGKAGIKKLKNIQGQDGFYFLKGRNEIIALRKEREKYSQEKLKIAGEIINFLKLIPSIKLIGITGALAVDNAKKGDDIDLFIITSKGLLWTTRFIVTLLVEFTGMRRHPKELNINNKICLNMFMDEDHLEIPQKEQDLFSAHEVLQMKPLFHRDNTYQKYLQKNKWVEEFLRNVYSQLVLTESDEDTSDGGPPAGGTPPRWRKQKSILGIVEFLLKSFQLWYMRNRRTNEVIKEGIIRFHPQDARAWVMRKYRQNLAKFNTDFLPQ